MMDEYEKIVQNEMQKAKDADKETNNNIRGNYMRNLGVQNNQDRDRFSMQTSNTQQLANNLERQPNHASIRSTGTYDSTLDSKTIRMENCETSPIEVKRTTMHMENEQPKGLRGVNGKDSGVDNRNSVQINNIKGYFNYKQVEDMRVGAPNNRNSQMYQITPMDFTNQNSQRKNH